MPSSTTKDIRQLRAERGVPCLSLTLSLARSRAGAHADRTKLKNALRVVDRQLTSLGMNAAKRKQFLAPIVEFSERELGLPHGGTSLGLFRSPTLFKAFFLEEELPDQSHLGETFDLHAVAPMDADGKVYVIAISKNSAKLSLVDCIAGTAKDIAVDGMPRSLQEAWRGKERQERSIQFHTLGGSGKGAQFHGQQSAKDEMKKEQQIYVQKVARALDRFFKRSTDPLIFAGVTSLFGMYKSVNRYPYFLHACLKGNPDELTAKQLVSEVKKMFR